MPEPLRVPVTLDGPSGRFIRDVLAADIALAAACGFHPTELQALVYDDGLALDIDPRALIPD